MRLVDSISQNLFLMTGQFATLTSPRLRQLSVGEVDRSGQSIQGQSLNALECYAPRVTFIVELPDATAADALKVLQAELQEQTFGVDGSTMLVKRSNVTAQFYFTGGMLDVSLSHAAVALAALKITNRGTAALRVRTRIEVYQTRNPPAEEIVKAALQALTTQSNNEALVQLLAAQWRTGLVKAEDVAQFIAERQKEQQASLPEETIPIRIGSGMDDFMPRGGW